jgi:hypothetical protein
MATNDPARLEAEAAIVGACEQLSRSGRGLDTLQALEALTDQIGGLDWLNKAAVGTLVGVALEWSSAAVTEAIRNTIDANTPGAG